MSRSIHSCIFVPSYLNMYGVVDPMLLENKFIAMPHFNEVNGNIAHMSSCYKRITFSLHIIMVIFLFSPPARKCSITYHVIST